jgi:hypothetical protein
MIAKQIDSPTFQQAMQSSDAESWCQAVQEEICSLEKNGA